MDCKMDEHATGKPVILDPTTARQMQARYACAGCYGPLNIYAVPGERTDRLTCDNCGDGRGFVTKAFVERRRSDNMAEAMEVNWMLKQAGVIEYTRRTAEEVLTDLGF
jgi:hypothetical protein